MIDKTYYTARSEYIYFLRRIERLTYRNIANRFGIGVERARQITHKQWRRVRVPPWDWKDLSPQPAATDDKFVKFLNRLPVRAKNALLNNDVSSFEELYSCSVEKLLMTPNFGPESLKELNAALVATFYQRIEIRATSDKDAERVLRRISNTKSVVRYSR